MKKILSFLLMVVLVICLFVGCDIDMTNRIEENIEDNIEDNTIETDYFSMSVPKTWDKNYKYYFRDTNEPGDVNLYVSMVSNNEFSEAHLFTVYILSLNNKENIELSLEGWMEPIAIVSKNGANMYLLGYNLASEKACTPEEEETFLQMIDDVPQIIETMSAENEYVLRKWDEGMIEEIIPGDYNTPYASISFDILNTSFNGYRNQTGATFIEQTTQGFLEPYYIKKLETIKYFYGTNDVVVGVKDNDIYLMTCWASDIVGHTSPQVREVINELGANELFEVYPAVLEVNNSYNSKTFLYWKIENGYIGFITIGSNEPERSYSSCVLNVLLFKDLSIINSTTN